MSGENFTFSEAGSGKSAGGVASGCGQCPLAAIPAQVWLELIRPPFRKRHPGIFWSCLGLLCVLGIWYGYLMWEDDPEDVESIALVDVQGAILDAAPTLEWIRKIEQSKLVKGIMVRVNSPGGGAAASQEIYAALARVGKRLPIVVSMGATAASGGLMISMAGQRIFANPSTVTGSIGVRMDIPQLQGLMDKIGVGQETLVTAPYKDAASYLHPLTPRDRAYLESVLENMHSQFVDIVAAGRHMPREKAAELASGKIFTGQEAKSLGLVDELGGWDEAHAWLAQKAGVPQDRPMLKKISPQMSLLKLALSMIHGVDLLLGNPDESQGIIRQMARPQFLYQF